MADESAIDPLGRAIVLHDATWYGHIVRNHREMGRLRREVRSVVASPVEIRSSASDADCRLYYGPLAESRLMICVVADVRAGLVKTAYLTRRIRKAGIIEWP